MDTRLNAYGDLLRYFCENYGNVKINKCNYHLCKYIGAYWYFVGGFFRDGTMFGIPSITV